MSIPDFFNFFFKLSRVKS